MNSPRARSLLCVFGAGWEFEVRHKEHCLPADTFPSSAVLPTFLLCSHLSAVIPPVSQCTILSFGTEQEVKRPQMPPALWSRSPHPPSRAIHTHPGWRAWSCCFCCWGWVTLDSGSSLGTQHTWRLWSKKQHPSSLKSKFSLLCLPGAPTPQSHNARFNISMGLGLLLTQEPHCWTKRNGSCTLRE